MQNPICVATGSFWKAFDERQELATRCMETFKLLPIDGIEFTLGHTLVVPLVTSEEQAYLNTLRHVSIHAHFSVLYEETPAIKDLILRTKLFYDQINAKNIVIHPNQIENYRLFHGMNYSTENLSRKANIPFHEYEELFATFPELTLTLDCGHALSNSAYELEQLITRFKDRIVQIHFHDYRNGDDHQPFCLTDDKQKYALVKTLDVPVVIEQMFSTLDLDLLRREIDFVRGYFNT